MKSFLKGGLALSILITTYQSTASQPHKSIILIPNNGIELSTVVSHIGAYRKCMDNVQFQIQHNYNNGGDYNSTNRAKISFNNARKNQCKEVYQPLKQSIDKKSLKLVDKLARKRWNKREVGPGFTLERILKNPKALVSGVELSRTTPSSSNSSTLVSSSEVEK